MRLALAALQRLAIAVSLAAASPALASDALPAKAPSGGHGAPAPATSHAAPSHPAADHGAPATPPAVAPAAATLVLYPALGRPTQVIVTGRALTSAGAGVARAAVEVLLAGQVRRVLSGGDGLFDATFAAPADRPYAAGPRAVQAHSGGAAAEGQVQIVEDGAPFLLVLEADELVGLAARRGEPGEEEATPAAMAALLRCMVEGTKPSVGAVALTGAGAARTARVQAALADVGFPFVGLVARPPTPRGAGLEVALRAVLSSFPQPVVLLGDAGGRAPERFAALRAEFPGRVVATYVRGSATGAADPRFEEMTLFTDPLRLAQAAAERGLADRACVERALLPPEAQAAAAAPLVCPPCPCAVPAADPSTAVR